MPDYQTLTLELDGPVAVLTINRPEVRNAINRELTRELSSVLDELAQRADLAALVLTGAGGKAFAAGADISELIQRRAADAFLAINTGVFRKLETFTRPTIAAVRGYALGGGCELALACDLRVCGQGARFGQPEVGLGIVPGAGACYRLPRLIGVGRAKELIYTGRIIDAAEALAIGLVNRVVSDDQVLSAALELARQIAAQDALAVRLTKLAIDGGWSGGAGNPLEMVAQAVCFESPAKTERMRAFLDQRGDHSGAKT